MSLSQENVLKFILETVQSGVFLKQKFLKKSWARIGRRREQWSGPEDPAWEWYTICWATPAYYSIFCLRFVFRLQFVLYESTSGVIVNNNKYWISLNLYGIWILEHKGAATLQKLGGNSGEARIKGAKRLKFEGGAQIEDEAREKAGGGVRGGGSVSPSL